MEVTMGSFKGTLMLFCLFICSCTCSYHGYKIPEDTKEIKYSKIDKHVITIDKNGNFYPIKKTGCTNTHAAIERLEKLEKASQKGEANNHAECLNPSIDYDSYLDGILSEAVKSDEILIYIHGGLNSEKSSISRAAEQASLIMNSNSKIYPIFINWRSGPATTYFDHLFNIRQGENAGWTGNLSAPVYLATDIGNSLINAPKAWCIQGIHSAKSILFNKTAMEDPSKAHILFEGKGKTFSNPLRTTCWWLTGWAKFITTPFVHTMARPAWDVMVRRTKTTIRQPQEFQESQNGHASVYDYCGGPYDGVRGSGALSIFLKKLKEYTVSTECKKKAPKITLVGHSMGAIIVDEMLKEILKDEKLEQIKIDKIIHMASADSISHLMGSVVPYLKKHSYANFYNLSLHPQNENREVTWWGLLPSGSLLVYIDNMYTTPVTQMDRTSGRWDNLKLVQHMFPPEVYDQMYFKIFGPTEDDGPQTHGAFDEYEYWEKEFYWK